MALPAKHIMHQGRVVASLGETALAALVDTLRPRAMKAQQGQQGADQGNNQRANQRATKAASSMPALPGPEIAVELPPRPADLIRDYVRHVGGDPGSYRGVVPPHLFPQWGFGLAAKTLRGVPYPLFKVLNGGCRLEILAPLPADEPLHVRARLEGIDETSRRAVLHQHIVTGTRSVPGGVVAHLYAIVPLGGRGEDKGQKSAPGARAAEPQPSGPQKQLHRVPDDARELAYWKLSADAGLAFAMLTGDFNPVHWIRPYARAFGFRSTILHGFSTMARAYEGLVRGLFAGDTGKIAVLDVRFTRPLVLPARVGLYVAGNQVFVGDAPGGPAYMAGSFETR